MDKKNGESKKISDKKKGNYPPVVTVLGHVDHGKTTLLDAIRKTNIAQREHGGITQKIGASTIEVFDNGQRRRITFIDTPGHETFHLMRSHGVQAADIGLLVISSSDGVMPQTRESIAFLKDSKIPFIVVFTKSDLPEKNTEKVKQQLSKEDVLLEGYGGEIPFIEVSAKTNTNIKELLELVLLVFELKHDSSVSEKEKFKGAVIESKQDPKKGSLVTAVVKNGTISIGDKIFCEGIKGRVRSITDGTGERVDSATIGEAIEVLGFDKAPPVGSVIITDDNASKAPEKTPSLSSPTSSSSPFNLGPEQVSLTVIICADTLGSLEAIVNSLPLDINISLQKTGGITPSDILFAKALGAIVLGFNIKIRPEVIKLAKTEKVPLKNYTLIYELIDEIKDVLEGKRLELEEEIMGSAKILAFFPFENTKVLGIKVLEGRVAKGDKVRLMRSDSIVGESVISSLRQGKNPISKAEEGQEAGAILAPFLDFTIGDMLLSYR